MEDSITNPELNGVGGLEGEGIGVIDLAYLRDLLGVLSDLEVSEFETKRFRVKFARGEEFDSEPLRNVGFSVQETESEPIDLARTRRQLQASMRNVWENPALWADTPKLKLDGTVDK